MKVYKIQAAVLRQKGGPLKIESLELEGPRDGEILVRLVASEFWGTFVQNVLRDFLNGFFNTDSGIQFLHGRSTKAHMKGWMGVLNAETRLD